MVSSDPMERPIEIDEPLKVCPLYKINEDGSTEPITDGAANAYIDSRDVSALSDKSIMLRIRNKYGPIVGLMRLTSNYPVQSNNMTRHMIIGVVKR